MNVLGKLPGSGLDLMYGIQDVLLGYAKAYARQLKKNPLPPFYHCGIRYRPEDPEQQRFKLLGVDGSFEDWADPYTVKERGFGDCDDMVLWRCAETLAGKNWQDGQPLPVWPVVANIIDTERYHVLLRHGPNGKLEDPARRMVEHFGDQKLWEAEPKL